MPAAPSFSVLPWAGMAVALGYVAARRLPYAAGRLAGAMIAGLGVYTASSQGGFSAPVLLASLVIITVVLISRRAPQYAVGGVILAGLGLAPIALTLRAAGGG